jgi:hypothetical protein
MEAVMAKGNPTNTPYNPPILNPKELGGDQGPAIDVFDEAIEVDLINVDVQILDGLSVGEGVTLKLNNMPISVTTLAGLHMGNIASQDEAEVKRMANKIGRVVKLQKGTQKCVVRISRKR